MYAYNMFIMYIYHLSSKSAPIKVYIEIIRYTCIKNVLFFNHWITYRSAYKDILIFYFAFQIWKKYRFTCSYKLQFRKLLRYVCPALLKNIYKKVIFYLNILYLFVKDLLERKKGK